MGSWIAQCANKDPHQPHVHTVYELIGGGVEGASWQPARCGGIEEEEQTMGIINTLLDGQTTALNERKRVYDFEGGNITLENVIELTVRPSGTHRLKTADGKLHVINTGWLAIHIEDDKHDWTV